MKKLTIYWGAPVFTMAERIWNRMCAENLRARGYDVIIPQDEAKQFTENGVTNANGVAEHCYQQAVMSDVMVAVLDGADSDSGASVEVGLRIGNRRATHLPVRIIGIRTDFRASEDGHLNAMFRLIQTIIYHMSFDEGVDRLCNKIEKAILSDEMQ